MNILILSVGTRNKVVQYFKKELQGRGLVIATDASELAPALYEADKYFIVPKINESNYIDYILKICKENNIDGVLSLIDPELSVLAKNKKRFLDIGTIPIVSDYEEVEISFDKYNFSKYIERLGFKAVQTYRNIKDFEKAYQNEQIDFPVFVKPLRGSASININKVEDIDQLRDLFNRFDDLIIQELMNGKEYGVDVFIDLVSKRPVSMFIKEKLLMRAGETDKSVSVKNNKLYNTIINFLKVTNYIGVIDIDIFEKNGEFFISEVNPRFGGGYPHAYECGVNIPNKIVKNLQNKINIPNFEYDEDVYMMKYNEIKILDKNIGEIH
ncbi:ATP-grasp domain-containing protein [Aerococcus sp. HMSC10H05]|uniref:ATP-grasp domain-containing protein n=1 Tax=Aerococcus sp. HMSC10H05 TaxID=1581084 RepID=UPI0008A56A01|nr:ATP-grasp domain-containing protein [Aerococcus sp. HMSC10H05]OFU49973.1 carbamoyl phosphate synthase [Aerococcus sp. HMSC10H05]